MTMKLLLILCLLTLCNACGDGAITAPSPQLPYQSRFPNPPLTPRDPARCAYLRGVLVCPVP